MSREAWIRERLRVVVVTDGHGDPARIDALARACLEGGVRAVQIREPDLDAARLAALCEGLRPSFDAAGALLMVNDRADVAAAGYAHGVHLGHRSLSPSAVRAFLDSELLVGVSAHDPAELRRAHELGADFAFLSPVFPTASKPDAQPLGEERAAEWTRAAVLPVVWLGGLDADRVAALVDPVPAAGVAVLGAVCRAADPRAASERIVRAVTRRTMGAS